MRAEADKITFLTQGYNSVNNTIIPLYEITVTRGMQPATLAVVVSGSVIGGVLLIAVAFFVVKKFMCDAKPAHHPEQEDHLVDKKADE